MFLLRANSFHVFPKPSSHLRGQRDSHHGRPT
ncbi:hypothetical protein M3J09_008686 [Ascochyta lentis]